MKEPTAQQIAAAAKTYAEAVLTALESTDYDDSERQERRAQDRLMRLTLTRDDLDFWAWMRGLTARRRHTQTDENH